MKVLVSLLTEKVEDVHLARRKVAYDRLVLVVHPGAEAIAEQVARAERDDEVVETVEIEGRDVRQAVETLREVIDSYEPEDNVKLNAGGGHAGLVTAIILMAYEEGLQTLFVQEGHVEQLPVLEGVRLEDRLGEKEEIFLSNEIGENRTLDDLTRMTGWSRSEVERICRSLEDKDLGQMRLDNGQAVFEATSTGRWVREHVVTEGS